MQKTLSPSVYALKIDFIEYMAASNLCFVSTFHRQYCSGTLRQSTRISGFKLVKKSFFMSILFVTLLGFVRDVQFLTQGSECIKQVRLVLPKLHLSCRLKQAFSALMMYTFEAALHHILCASRELVLTFICLSLRTHSQAHLCMLTLKNPSKPAQPNIPLISLQPEIKQQQIFAVKQAFQWSLAFNFLLRVFPSCLLCKFAEDVNIY